MFSGQIQILISFRNSVVDVLVENLGRINSGRVVDFKGLGGALVEGEPVTSCEHRSLEMIYEDLKAIVFTIFGGAM